VVVEDAAPSGHCASIDVEGFRDIRVTLPEFEQQKHGRDVLRRHLCTAEDRSRKGREPGPAAFAPDGALREEPPCGARIVNRLAAGRTHGPGRVELAKQPAPAGRGA